MILRSTQSAQANIFDDLQGTIQSTTVLWMNNSLAIATVLFSIMMGVSFITAITRYASLNHTIEGFGHMFMDMFIKVIPLYVIMAGATTFLPNIVNLANSLGSQITGSPVNGPSEIFSLGITMSQDILKASILPFQFSGVPIIGPPAIVFGLITGAVGLVTSLFIVVSFALIAFEYFFAFAQAYITLSVGAFSLGWLASPGTKHMGESYLAGAWMSVMRLVITIATSALIVATVPHMTALANTSDPTKVIMSWFGLVGSTIFAALLAIKVPALAQHMFSGQPAVSAPEVAGSIIRTARSFRSPSKKD